MRMEHVLMDVPHCIGGQLAVIHVTATGKTVIPVQEFVLMSPPHHLHLLHPPHHGNHQLIQHSLLSQTHHQTKLHQLRQLTMGQATLQV